MHNTITFDSDRTLDMLGVPGRLMRRTVKPWAKPALWTHQDWTSEARIVKGYGERAFLRVNVRFDDDCNNGHNTFAITGDVRDARGREIAMGCLHDDIAQVFPELSHLIQWHLCSSDGPMHYIANTLYHVLQHGATHAWVYYTGAGNTDPLGIVKCETKERLLGYVKSNEVLKAEGQPGYRIQWDEKTVKVRNLTHARNCAVWPDATDEQLSAPRDALKAALEARLPDLLIRFRADIESTGFYWTPESFPG